MSSQFLFIRIRYDDFAKVTHVFPYTGHSMVQFMTFMESQSNMAIQVIKFIILLTLYECHDSPLSLW